MCFSKLPSVMLAKAAWKHAPKFTGIGMAREASEHLPQYQLIKKGAEAVGKKSLFSGIARIG